MHMHTESNETEIHKRHVCIRYHGHLMQNGYSYHFADKQSWVVLYLEDNTNKPRHEISNNVVHVCATSRASDQPAQTRSLLRAFASRLNIL